MPARPTIRSSRSPRWRAVFALLLVGGVGGCAWIPAEDLKAALENEAESALDLQIIESPVPAALSDCSLPAEPTVRLAFADAFAGRTVTISSRLDSQSQSVPIDAFDLPDVLDPTLTVAIPVLPGDCPEGCSTVTIEARATDEDGIVHEQQVDTALEVRVFEAGLAEVIVGADPAAAVTPTPSDASPAQALDVDVHGTLSFTLTADRATELSDVLPDLSPLVEACVGASCQVLSTEDAPEGPADGAVDAIDRYTADLAELAATCGDALPDAVTLQIRLESTAFTAESGCADRIYDPQVPAARFVVRDCDADEHEAEAWDGDDCDDQEPAVFFDAGPEQLCDDLDNNCNGQIDEVGPYYQDTDMDGFGDEVIVDADCDNPPNPITSSLADGDCEDGEPSINPNSPEIPCDGLDNDCSAASPDDDMAIQWFEDLDGDLTGDPDVSFTTSCPQLLTTPVVDNALDCAPANALEPQVYADDLDSDGLGDPGTGTLTCSGEPDALGRVPNEDDCDDSDASVGAAATWYPDADGDGLGTPGVGMESCSPIAQRAPNDWDCQDVAGVYTEQASFGLIVADSTPFPASGTSAFDWQTADTYSTLEICPSTSGAVPIPTTTLSSPVTITSPTATRMPVRPAVPSTPLFTVDTLTPPGSVELSSLAIEGNGVVSTDGGCISVVSGVLDLVDVSMTGCETTGSGGAVHVDNAMLNVLDGSELTDNTAQDGGAISGFAAEIDVEDSLVARNQASNRGGGVFAEQSALVVLSSDVDDNTAAVGGGIALAASDSAQVTDVGMRRNAAPDGSALTTGSDGAPPQAVLPPLLLTDVVIETGPVGGDSTVFVDQSADPPDVDVSLNNVILPIHTDAFHVRFEGGSGVFFIGTDGSCSQTAQGCSP